MYEKSPLEGVEEIVPAPEKIEENVKGDLAILKFVANIAVLYLGRIPAVFVGMISGDTKDEWKTQALSPSAPR